MAVAQSTPQSTSAQERSARDLYQQLIGAWNARNASAFAALFTDDAICIGFDGSQMIGRDVIASTLEGIFAHHPTATYVTIVKEIRTLASSVLLLRGVVGMVPPGQTDLNPAVNAIQVLIAVERDGRWRIGSFQNTPAAFHGRPDLSEQLTTELRDALRRTT